MMTLIVA